MQRTVQNPEKMKDLDQLVMSEFDRAERAGGRRNPRAAETAGGGKRGAPLEEKRERTGFGEDGDRFIADAVAWLREREDRDAVLSCIAERLRNPQEEALSEDGDCGTGRVVDGSIEESAVITEEPE